MSLYPITKVSGFTEYLIKKQLCHYTRLLLINLYYDYIINRTKKQDAKRILQEKL